MTYILTICILVIFILMLVRSIVFCKSSFKNEIKKTKWHTTKFAGMITLLSAILSLCKYLYDKDLRFVMQHGKIDIYIAINVLCFFTNIVILLQEIILDIYYYKLYKSGKSTIEITTNDKPKFLAFLTTFSFDKTKKDERTFFKKVTVCFFPIMLPIYMLFIFGVIDLYFANLSEWKFNFWDLFPFTLLAFLAGILLVCATALFVKGKIFDLLVITISMLSIMSYIHAYFMPQEMIYGESLNIPEADIMINVLVWSAIVIVPLYIYKAHSKAMIKAAMYFSTFLFLIQLAPLPILITNGIDDIQEKEYVSYTLSGKEQYEVSSKNNVIVFVMDTFYSGYFTELLENNPEYYDTLRDFIYYDNVSS
ncbi:MAG: hypothetical protein IJZ47_05780 [Oscillospiraceae bacterium]|nr:hypothetical protein [Oscillospiraceae bacterium]